jgi:peptidyl-prolyl cis-trans isomerase C
MSSCNKTQTSSIPSTPLPVISINGVQISETDLANELQYHSNKDFSVVVQESAQALVIRQLLLNEGKEKGLDASTMNEEMLLQTLLKDNVVYDDPSQEDCKRYFKNNTDKLISEPLIEVQHILLMAPKEDLLARDKARKTAQTILETLKKNIELFSELALRYSSCPSKKQDGLLGQLTKGQTVPEFERQLMRFPQGLIQKSIESRYGVHVVNIVNKVNGKPLKYSMVEDRIKGYLKHRASHLGIQAFIQTLVEKSSIEGIRLLFTDKNIHI